MKRLLQFNYCDGKYVIIENEMPIFNINADNMRFDSRDFYEGIFSDASKSVNIELSNIISNDPPKKGKYIYDWLTKIFDAISVAFKSDETTSDTSSDSGITKASQIPSSTNTIPLFDMAACAGNGNYLDNTVPHSDLETINNDADFAVKLSGHSMEPDYPDGCIVLVKETKDLSTNDICIVTVDGETMCKLYKKSGRGSKLIPLNSSGGYQVFESKAWSSITIHGKVIGIHSSPYQDS